MSYLGRKLLKGLKEANMLYTHKAEKEPWYKALWYVIYFSKLYDTLAEPYNISRRFINKCVKIVQFIPVIWRHEDWDSAYTLEFMSYLFKRLYTAIYVEGHHVELPSHKRRLKTAVELLKRMSNRESVYTEAHEAYLEKKFGPAKYSFITSPVTANSRITGCTMVDDREQRLDPSERLLYNKMKKHIHTLEDSMFKQDMELFCKILKKDVRNWWD